MSSPCAERGRNFASDYLVGPTVTKLGTAEALEIDGAREAVDGFEVSIEAPGDPGRSGITNRCPADPSD